MEAWQSWFFLLEKLMASYKFDQKLEEGVFLKRYKRFFADIEWKGQVITAHTANTGSLKTCLEPGRPCLFRIHDDPNRKLKYSLEMIRTPDGWVGINTSIPNQIVKTALTGSLLSHWKGWDDIKSEFKLNPETRLDFKLSDSKTGTSHFIEVKNVTMATGLRAQFPDAVTTRGQKHLRELMTLMEEGHSAELVFVVQRPSCQVFSPADEIDPEYGRLLRQAIQKGLRVTPLVADLSDQEVRLTGRVLEIEI